MTEKKHQYPRVLVLVNKRGHEQLVGTGEVAKLKDRVQIDGNDERAEDASTGNEK